MSNKKKLSGGKLPGIVAMNTFLYGESDPDMPRIDSDIKDIASAMQPKLKGVGTIVVFGTGGSDKTTNDFRKLWEDKPIK